MSTPRSAVITVLDLGPTMEATAAALFGEIQFHGRLPVEIAELHARGEGVSL